MSAARPYQLHPERVPTPPLSASDSYQWIKFRVFDLTLENLERQGLDADTVPPATLQDQIATALSLTVQGQGAAFNQRERAGLIDDVMNEILGLGPLQPFLEDPEIDDIVVNGPNAVYVERAGSLEEVPVRFRDAAHLMNIIQRIVSPIGRRVDESSPYVDGRLPDGSRVHVVIPPVALEGPVLSVRKFKRIPLTGQELVAKGAMTAEMLDYLAAAIASRKNILICGGTGTGKTTLLNVLSSYIGAKERLVTIEDAAELRLQKSHVVRLETRPASADGTSEVSARDLMRNALRMRPDRIILGEVRSSEAIEMLQAMGTGHDGSMATIHANGPRDALERLEMLMGLNGFSADLNAVRRFIASAVDVVVQAVRRPDGSRGIAAICEVTDAQGGVYLLRERFRVAADTMRRKEAR
ncbi:MAG TPA: CpaF family protein [Rhizomicrobium sp.]|jgi:pilus assembly protein CpaF|nr:CpaF family protein [Rhizomicrobium sp.]